MCSNLFKQAGRRSNGCDLIQKKLKVPREPRKIPQNIPAGLLLRRISAEFRPSVVTEGEM